jgi:pilus assembly protein CpaB
VNLLVKQRGGGLEIVPIVVAAADVPRGGVLSAKQVATRNCPRDLVPLGAITNPAEVLGRVVVASLARDEPILERELADKNAKGGLADLVPKGMRAFTIQTPTVASGVAGFILPGNKVDVLLTLSSDGKTGGGMTTTLLQNIEILSVNQLLDAPSEHKVDPNRLQSVTLLVTPDQAAKLDLGQNRGQLHLSLRNPEDGKPAKTTPATLTDLQFYQEKPRPEPTTKSRPEAQEPKAVAKAAPEPPSPEPPLMIRTLRGKYYGVVAVEGASRSRPSFAAQDRTE